MDATAVTCPNCGAVLGAPQGGQYVCSFCGHRSLPVGPVVDQAAQDELVARAIAKHDAAKQARFDRERASAEASVAREQAAADAASKRLDKIGQWGQVAISVGSAVWVLGCLGVAACWVLSAQLPDSIVKALPCWTSGGYKDGPATNALLFSFIGFVLPPAWPFGVFLLRFRARRIMRRLSTRGVRGRGVVLSYRPWNAGAAPGEVVLRVELPGRAAYNVTLRYEVSPGGPGWMFACLNRLVPGAELPIVVDPGRPKRVVVDWDTALEMSA